jgi:hypothetical protein
MTWGEVEDEAVVVLFAGSAALLLGVGSLARSLGLCSISIFGKLPLQTHLHNNNSTNRKKEFLWSGLLSCFERSCRNGKSLRQKSSKEFPQQTRDPDIDVLLPWI